MLTFFVVIRYTGLEAQELWLQLRRSLTGEQRLLMALRLSEFARELTRTDIRKSHPDWAEAQIAHELLGLAFLPDPMPPGLEKHLEHLPLA